MLFLLYAPGEHLLLELNRRPICVHCRFLSLCIQQSISLAYDWKLLTKRGVVVWP